MDRDSLTKLAKHILSNQFVAAGGILYKVIRGTGMGMISSGDIADWLLFWLLEKHFLLLARVRERFSTQAYFKFKDDLFLVTSGPDWSLQALLRVMAGKSKFHMARYVFKGES